MPDDFGEVQAVYSLSDEMLTLARANQDADLSNVGTLIGEFQKRFTAKRSLNWSYLTDENFEKLVRAERKPEAINRLLLSHLIRLAEAYQVMSVWRAVEVAAPAVRALNSNEITAACVLTRSLLELAASFALAVPQIEKWFRSLPWESASETLFGAEEMEQFLTKLVFGWRLDGGDDALKQTNIVTLIQKLDKLAVQRGLPSKMVEERYAVLSEAAHPNHLGFERFTAAVSHDAGTGWSSRQISVAAKGGARDHLVVNCLWALAFAHSIMLANVSRIDEAKKAYLGALGPPLPQP